MDNFLPATVMTRNGGIVPKGAVIWAMCDSHNWSNAELIARKLNVEPTDEAVKLLELQ